ncbi:unnamed protein product [Triticum turgidum subsp. durum]|uniref:Uncharacterized protein n=1 Tax=Triticum turgidum subsp. durum TaxID=4567 RepID=A0A9R0SX58_TRITD|nr:unnamed protein product [Triticum turgidum subsp. durum]
MALTNFIVTAAVVGGALLLFTTDVRKSGAVFRRNARQIRQWLEEDNASAASKYRHQTARSLACLPASVLVLLRT